MRPRQIPPFILTAFLFGLAMVVAGEAIPASDKPGRISFGVFGDLPYNAAEEKFFPELIEEINQERELDFVVHVGDFKDGGFTRCSDQVFQRAKAWLELFRYPVIYTPGDNEWTDCHRPGLGKYDPLERLDRLRQIFFQEERSLGQRSLPLTRQSTDPAYAEFRENARWIMEEVVFATLHVVGSNNNLGRTAEGDAEHRRRMTATLSWMKEAFAVARLQGMRAVVLILHANPQFEKKPGLKSGFHTFLAELETQSREFQKPVLLIHGDTHTFRVDQPLRENSHGPPAENLTRLETFGSPTMDWVKVTIDPGAAPRFKIEPARFGRKSRRERREPS